MIADADEREEVLREEMKKLRILIERQADDLEALRAENRWLRRQVLQQDGGVGEEVSF